MVVYLQWLLLFIFRVTGLVRAQYCTHVVIRDVGPDQARSLYRRNMYQSSQSSVRNECREREGATLWSTPSVRHSLDIGQAHNHEWTATTDVVIGIAE